MFYIMRLVELKRSGNYQAVYKQLPKLNSLVRFVASFKFKGNTTSFKGFMFLVIGLTLLCMLISLVQTVLSIYFWDWFGFNRMLAMYLMSLGVMLCVFGTLTMVSNYVRGMSAKIDRTLNQSKYLTVIGFVAVYIIFTFFKADDYAMIMTIEMMVLIVGFVSIFVERDFNSTKIETEQFEELLEVRALNLQLKKLRSKIGKKDAVLKTQIDELYKKSSEIESDLTRFFYD